MTPWSVRSPVPKVIDFGITKAISQRLTERTMFTHFGVIVGTLEYMSPEQADMSGIDVDTRTDVYALGVLIYELLTGTTPLQRGSLREAAFGEVLRRIREEEPPKQSTRISESGEQLASISAHRKTERIRLTRLVRGELDWIVMKALEKDRGRRYETANGFAQDIRRYLEGDPVEACPPSTSYKLKKFARKHRGALATAGAFAYRLQADRETAAGSLARLGAAGYDLCKITDEIGDVQDALLACEESLAIREQLVRENPSVTQFQSDLARTHSKIGRLQSEIGRQAEAMASFEKVRPIRERLACENPKSSDFANRMGMTLDIMGEIDLHY